MPASRTRLTCATALICWWGFALPRIQAQPSNPVAPSEIGPYEFRAEHDPNGTGKFFMGREIAQVMGYPGAIWLERTNREDEERTDLLLPALKLKGGDVVADIGCGSGYYTRQLAYAVGPEGVVYAVDIQPEMLELLTNKLAALNIRNVKPVLGATNDPMLCRQSVDLILLVDVYHEFNQPFEMVQAMTRALKPGGRVVFVEFRAEDLEVAVKPLHKMTEAQVRKEMTVQSLEWVETIATLPQQHVIVFRKKSDLLPASKLRPDPARAHQAPAAHRLENRKQPKHNEQETQPQLEIRQNDASNEQQRTPHAPGQPAAPI